MKSMKLIANQILNAKITGYSGKYNNIVQYVTTEGIESPIEITRHQNVKREDLTGLIIDFVADSGEIYSGNDRVGFIF